MSWSRVGFLLACFLMPGLIGTYASFSIPAPLVDEMHQQAALDAVLAAPEGSAAQRAAITALPLHVDADTAAIVMQGHGPIAERVRAATQNMRVEVVEQARISAYNIRLMVITMTVLGAMLGVAIMGPTGRR